MPKHQATKLPAPDPLPGPTGIEFDLAHLIKSLTIENIQRISFL